MKSRPPSARIRVVIVDDSDVCRALLRDVLEAEADVTVVGEASSPDEAFDVVRTLRPDIVTMDVRMPGGSGLDAVTQLMREVPTPILVVTELARSDDGIAFEATRRGALDVARKPALGDHEAERALRERLKLLARVKVVRHTARARGDEHTARIDRSSGVTLVRMVGVAASAGGPLALAALLGALPRDFPACIAVVQHLPLGFATSFARFLAGRVSLPVSVASGTVPFTPGRILLAPDGAHLVAVSEERFAPSGEAARAGHRPAADVLFESLARHHAARACGIVLSGIGRDGAAGLLAMRARGAQTIAEAESTATVYGMPRAAKENGAAEHVLAAHEIPDALMRFVRGRAA